MTTGLPSAQKWATLYSSSPLVFELNRGQADGAVKYLARGQGYTLYLTGDEAVLTLQKASAVSLQPSADGNSKLAGRTPNPESRIPAVLRLQLAGAKAAAVEGEGALPGESNYFVGNEPSRWHRHIPTYAKVRYRGVYQGVDVVYYGQQGQLENDFEVAAGANARQIELQVEGAEGLAVDGAGDLVLKVAGEEIRFHQPVAYQGSGESRRQVEARYQVRGRNRIGFAVGGYDRGQALVIDPVLSYATYLGGTGGDVAYGIAVDTSGNAYVAGTTGSLNFPTTTGVFQSGSTGNGDVFVTKFDPASSSLLYSTYIGGGGADNGTAIAVDSAGYAYVVGSTTSTDFPVTTNALQATYAGGIDGFIVKLDPAGASLAYASYFGGSGSDAVQAVAVDGSGNVYVTGSTQSTNFPTVNPLQIGIVGSTDAFIAKFNLLPPTIVYSTYLGGSSADLATAIAVDTSQNVYIAGYTYSSDFPTQNALQSKNAGNSDAFVVELNAAGTSLLFSTYFGGAGVDKVFGMALDSAGSVYVTGSTLSNDFPTTLNAAQITNAGQGDAFVFKLGLGGSSLVYSTLLGGTGADQGNAIALDSSTNAYITGFTQSSDFPIVNSLQTILGISGAGSCGTNVCSDAFVTKLSPSGALADPTAYSTYLGGSSSDFGQAIAVDAAGNAYLAGGTSSQNFPVIAGAVQGSFAGNSGNSMGFVAVVANLDAPGMSLSPQQINFGNVVLNNPSTPSTVNLINAGSAPLDITDISVGSGFSQTNTCGTRVPAGGGTCTIQVVFTPTAVGATTDEITITDNASGSPHRITLTGSGTITPGTLSLSATSLTFSTLTVGQTSLPQTVRLTNTGTVSVTLKSLTITGDFTETSSCGTTFPTILNVGDSCTFTVQFTPTSSGSRTGALSITDDAGGGTHTVSLSGIGSAVFSLSTSARSTNVVIGTTSVTFTIFASASSSFVNTITLSCSSGATCAFNPTSITAGQSSTLTVSGLSATTPNPLNITVSGSSGTQSASVVMSVFFQDFSLAVTPTLLTVSSGQAASYTVTVTPIQGFDQVVLLGCDPATSFPQSTTCTWNPPGMTLNGSTPSTAIVTLTTTKQSTASGQPPPGSGSHKGPGPGVEHLLLLLAGAGLLAFLAAQRLGDRGEIPAQVSVRLRLAALTLVLLLTALWAGCNTYGVGTSLNPAPVTGTPTGVYTITLRGAMGNNSAVSRTVYINLSVGP